MAPIALAWTVLAFHLDRVPMMHVVYATVATAHAVIAMVFPMEMALTCKLAINQLIISFIFEVTNLFRYDMCGVCGGNNACAGCDGVAFSGLVYDFCGVCGGYCTRMLHESRSVFLHEFGGLTCWHAEPALLSCQFDDSFLTFTMTWDQGTNRANLKGQIDVTQVFAAPIVSTLGHGTHHTTYSLIIDE